MENKRITHAARAVIEVVNVGIFASVWLGFYNRFAFDRYKTAGALVTIFIFFLLYNVLCRIYKSFRIASYPIGETVFSQILSFGITDLVLYIECCLISNRYVNILPGLLAVVLQVLCTAVWAWAAKLYFIKHITPSKTVFIYGSGIDPSEINDFKSRILLKYRHLFDVTEMISEETADTELRQKIDGCHTVLFYEVSFEKRSMLGEYAVKHRKTLYLTPRLEDIVIRGCGTKHLLDTPLLKFGYADQKKPEALLKQIVDIVFSLLFFLLTSPVMLLTALAIKLEDGGPVFYKQDRCTKDGRVFKILKFRSMVVDAEKNGAKLCVSGDSRITRVGRFIRKTRIDELPQIINILKGDMSFVGPRPERVEHVKKYTEALPEFQYRLRVKGGLTGYAQIFGKYNSSAYDKLRLDLMYIVNQSFLLDLKIILLTIKIVFIPESTEGFTEDSSKKEHEKTKRYPMQSLNGKSWEGISK